MRRVFEPRESGQPVSGYWVDVGCSACGGPLEHVTAGTPGTDTRAIARCARCGTAWGVVVQLENVSAYLAKSDGRRRARGRR